MKIALGSDHGGLELKRKVFEFLKSKNFECIDCGTYDDNSVDYPDYAKAVCDEVLSCKAEKGILFCGTGIGISIAANKINGIRCANLSDTYSAAKCVEHNDCNVISLGGRTLGVEIAFEIVDKFLASKFEGGRHKTRIEKIMEIEKNNIGR